MEDTVAHLLNESIPPARLGELLREARRRRGWKRKDVAAQVAIDADRLRAWERGTKRVPDDVFTRLAGLYGDDLALPTRQPVSADTDWLVVGPYEQPLMEGTPEEVIQGYIKIVQRLRKTKSGKSLELRAGDVQVLAQALQGDPEEIERRIADALGCSRDEARALHAEMLRRKVLLPVASLAVGIAAIAGVSHATSADAAAPSAPAPKTPAVEQVAQVREMWDAVPAPTTTVAPAPTIVPAPPVTTAVVPVPDTRVEHPQPDPIVQPVTTTTAISHLEIIEGQEPTGDVGILPGEDQHGPILGPPGD
jgi:transcriptional regulator with XRE-family HTH domain